MNAAAIRVWHRWLFLFVGVQMLLWMAGGFYMVAVPLTIIHGDHLLGESAHPELSLPDAGALHRLLDDVEGAVEISAAPQLGPAIAKVATEAGVVLYDFERAEILPPPGPDDIARIAQDLRAGGQAPVTVTLLAEPLTELQGRELPLWRADFDGPFHPTFYFTPETGELAARRHDLWRFFDFVWMLHIMDYEDRADVNNWLLRIAAGISLLAVLTGAVLVFHSFRRDKNAVGKTRTGLAAGVHKWLTAIIGAQLVIWVASGLAMSVIPADAVKSDQFVASRDRPRLTAGDVEAGLRDIADASAVHWRLAVLDGEPLYVSSGPGGGRLYSARDGASLVIDEERARAIAERFYIGNASLRSLRRLAAPGIENRTFNGPAWRAEFADAAGTTLYISAETGELQAARNNAWRVFDTFWMLHMMDYPRANSFNWPWTIMAGFLALWIGISGFILLTRAFRPADFAPRWLKPSHRLAIFIGGRDAPPRRITAPRGASLFSVLNKAAVPVASSCGGGGSCGLCTVDLGAQDVEATAADRRHLAPAALQAGRRLSCQHRIASDLDVVVPPPPVFQDACVVGARMLSPGIAEITLSMNDRDDYAAGQHRLVHIPEYRLDARQAALATGCETPSGFRNRERVTRAYSMAAPCRENPNELVFNVRLMPPGAPDAPPGLGASYMASRRLGDVVRVSGPRGDFTVRPGHETLIMIGGGAGMAPLRAMIRDRLLDADDRRPIVFFYGARSERDLIYKTEFELLDHRHARFTYLCAVSGEDALHDARTPPLPACHIHDLAREVIPALDVDYARTGFYVCGPPAMLEAARAMLKSLGVPDANILVDDFGI